MKRITREWVKKAEADFAAALREASVPALRKALGL